MKYAALILCFVCACTIVWNVKATPLSSVTESHIEEESQDRVRRDVTGLFDKMGNGGADNPFADIFKMVAQGIKTFTTMLGGGKS